MSARWQLVRVAPPQIDEAVEILCEAFFDYPVMRFVIGPAGAGYASRLRRLIGFLTAARFLRGDPVLAAASGRGLAAVANVSLPGASGRLPALEQRRRELWQALGVGARRRYEAFGRAIAPFARPEPHHHLSMIGVRRRHSGKGLGRLLLDAVHELSLSDPDSHGVSLTTEDPANVPLYEHFGYRIVGRVRVGELVSWTLFRPRPPEGGRERTGRQPSAPASRSD